MGGGVGCCWFGGHRCPACVKMGGGYFLQGYLPGSEMRLRCIRDCRLFSMIKITLPIHLSFLEFF